MKTSPEPDTPAVSASSAVSKFTWMELIPAQKRTNFYLKVLTFAASQDLKMSLKVEVTIEATRSKLSGQKIEETKIALREVGLDDKAKV